MQTRGWPLSTFVGCCIWILHGLGTAAAVPVTTEGTFATGTASPIKAESEGPGALVMGTVKTSTLAADAGTVETILTESPPSPSFPPGAEPNALVTAASEYGSTAPALTNVTKPLNTPQDFERSLAAPAAATTVATISAQHPAVTPEAELDVTAAGPSTPLGTTTVFPDMKEDVAAVTRGRGEDLNPTTESLPTTPPPAQPAAGSPVFTGVTMLPNQGLTTATGAVEEGIPLPLEIQSEDSANSSSPKPSTGGLLMAQQDRVVSGAVSITPEPVGEMTTAAEENLSASVPGDAGDAVNGGFSPAASTFLPLESPTVSGTVGNIWEPSLLPGQAVLSPTPSLAPASSEDGDGQGTPTVSMEAPGSTLSPVASEAPKATEDTAISLLGPEVPMDVLSGMNPLVLATSLPRGDMGAVHLAKPSLQPAPWQTLAGEQPPLPAAALPFPGAPGAAYPPPGTGSGTLPAADDGAETPASPDLIAARGAPVSPSLRGSQPWEMAAGGPQDADGTGLNSASDASNPASFLPEGLTWPAAVVQGQGAESAEDTAQSGGPGNGSPYADTQRDMNPSAFSAQQDPLTTGELPAVETGALVNAELSPLSALGDRAAAGAVPPLGQGPLLGPAPPGSAGLKPGILGAEGPGHLPGEPASAPGAAYPSLGSAAGPMSGAETPVSPDLSAAQGAPVPPSFGESQPLGMAAGAPQGPGLPGPNGPSTGLTSARDGPSAAAYGPAGPPSPALGVQLGTNVGLPAAGEHGAGPGEQALGGAGSGTGFEPPLIPAAGSGTVAGMDQMPGAGSSFGPASPSGAVTASSISEGDAAGPIPAAALGPDSLSSASPDSETGSELPLVQGTESRGDAAQAGNPEKPYTETGPSAFSAQQVPSNTGKLPAVETGTSVNAELSPLSALEDRAAAGAVPPLGQGPLLGPAPPGSAGLEPGILGAEGPGHLPGEPASAPGAAYPSLGSAAGPMSGAETPVSPDLSAAKGAPVPPSFGESQPLGMAAGAPQGPGLPGPNGPSTGLTSARDGPSAAAYGPAGPPSPALGVQLGTNVGLPAAGEHGAGPGEQALGGAGSGTGFEPPLIPAAGSGTVAGMDQLPGAGSSFGPASPSGAVAASSISDPSSLSASGALPPSLGAGPEVAPASEGALEVAGDGGSLGQSQAPAGEGPAGSGAPDGEMRAVLQSASSSPSAEGSSSPSTAVEAANGANLPAAGGDLSTDLEAAGPEERPVPAPGIQSGASPGLPDAKLSQANVVELPGGSLVNGGPSPHGSLGEGAGAIMRKTSGAPAPSALTSSREVQPLVPVAPASNSISSDMATSMAASLPLPRHGLSSGLAPNGNTNSAPGTRSGSRPLMPAARGGLAGDAGGAQTWSLEDEVASGMPAPLGEVSPLAPAPPGAALALPSAPQRENTAEGVSTSPRLSAPLPACKSVVGSSAGGRGDVGAAAPGGPALLLPAHQMESPGAPSGDADSPVPGEASAMLPGAIAGQGDAAPLLPSTTGARADVETTDHSLLGGSPGLSGLPPTGIAAGSPTSKILGPGPAGGSSPAAVQLFLGSELTTSLVNRAPATGGSSLPTGFPGQGGARVRSPATTRTATTSLAPPVPIPEDREALPRPEATTVISRASSPVFPAPPGGPAAAPTPLPGPAVAAVPLYEYGVRENDQQYVERRVDFNSPLFKPETGFPFGKTLRDSLYFTDNGQIIFPASDNSIFIYPNPPPSGFNGHEEVPMIAVFWDNADFSRGVGTTYYQEYITLNTAKPPFVRDVEAKVRRYLRSSYSAVWTLKITWERAPAYTARTDTHRTITYQAVLTTDGFWSYILMLYQDGGMQWDYTRLAATNVLIGYTSGDGFYHNDDLTQRPPAAKYRPDQFRGYNTDLRGLWIYKLESRVGINYRLKCLAWTGRQQEPQSWSQGLPACPCSLQQGQQDPRFKSSRGGWWAARVSMLHSASPNQHGAGIRCMYDSQNQLIEGRQERYWRSFRQASPYRDQELKMYDWCCNQAGSAHLCARYSEKRPKIGCDGYQLPVTGSSEESESYSEEQRGGEDE
ncbi:uncharacterized protein ACIB01_011639 isoform 1-T2 [Guaruba guarouba]